MEEMGIAHPVHNLSDALSGGQQQIDAIARALTNDPPITTDESTGNLDIQTADRVFRLFERLAQSGKTILLVAHDN